MNRIQKTTTILIISTLVSVILSSCYTSSTMITGTWEKENTNIKYDNIVVAALTSTVRSKTTIERNIVEKLRKKGINATESTERIPQKFIDDDNQKQRILNSIRNDGIDAILTVTLIDKDTETRYVPGTDTYAPYPYYNFYGTFWGYYNYWYPRFDTPGYYTEDKIYFIETNLYDADTEELIWSAQSETYNPINLETFSNDFADAIVGQLATENLI